MKNLKQTKEYIVSFVRENDACESQLSRAENSKTKTDLLKVVSDNLNWVTQNKLFNGVNILEYFTQKDLIEHGVGNLGFDNTGLANSGNWNSGNWNSGNRNSGDSNSGDSNSGNWNSGNRNSGNWNSGNWNSGNRNSGDSNSGDSNSGNSNSGDRNSGNWNSGNRNSGNWNSGNWNSGNRNSGDSNSGYRNSGAFCTDPNPKLVLFDVQTDILVKDWEQSEVVRIMSNIDPTIWVDSSIMSSEEKSLHPKHETTGGYLKTISMKDAWLNMWGNLPDDKKQLFLDLPNFDAGKFEEITGIKTTK